MADSFPKLMLDTKPQIQEAQKTTRRIMLIIKIHIGISYSNFRRLKIMKRSWQKPANKNTIEEQR